MTPTFAIRTVQRQIRRNKWPFLIAYIAWGRPVALVEFFHPTICQITA